MKKDLLFLKIYCNFVPSYTYIYARTITNQKKIKHNIKQQKTKNYKHKYTKL